MSSEALNTIEEEKVSPYVLFLKTYAKTILVSYFVILIGLAVYGFGVFSVLSTAGWTAPTSESSRMQNLFGNNDNITQTTGVIILMESQDFTVYDDSFRNAYLEVKEKLTAALPVSHFESYFDYSYMTGMVSVDGHKAYATAELPDSVINYNGVPPYTYHDFSSATKGVPLKITYAGDYLSSVESSALVLQTLQGSETSAAPVLIVLLIIAFDGLAAIMLPLLLILWNIIVTFSVLRLVALGFHVSQYTTDVTFVFGAGLAIDFCLFMHLRFTEEMRKRSTSVESEKENQLLLSVDRMLKTSGRTILFSALLLTATLVGSFQFHEYYLTTMALAVIIPAISAAIGSVTFVPVIYLLMKERIFYGSVKPLRLWLFSKFQVFFAKIYPTSASTGEKNIDAKQYQGLELVAAADAEGGVDHRYDEEGKKNEDEQADIENQATPVGEEETAQQKEMILGGEEENNNFQGKENELENGSHVAVQIDPKSPKTGEDAFLEVHSSDKLSSTKSPLEDEGYLYRLIIFVMTYPWPFIIVISAGFIALLWVFVSQVRLANQSYGSFPLNSPTRYVVETIVDDFPKSNGQGSLTIYLQTTNSQDVRSSEFVTSVYNFCNSLPQEAVNIVGVTSITTAGTNKTLNDYLTDYANPFNPAYANFTKPLILPFHLTDFDRLAVISVATSIQASSLELGKTVRAVRRLVDKTFSDIPVTNSQTGETYQLISVYGTGGGLAVQYDLNRDVVAILPNVITVILLSMYFFIVMLTGSLVLPLKSILCAGLSICASFGFLVLVIQDGNGANFLQFRNNLKCLDPLQLIFIFVVSFGLSLDYEVFLLGRIQENYEKTKDNFHSVAKGIATSGLVITFAAALLCTAIGGFISSDVLLLKQIGMGIGLTILLDATIVRCLLVPALMSVLGDWNWYAPQFVKDMVKYFGVQH